jgi:hypothetical protein
MRSGEQLSTPFMFNQPLWHPPRPRLFPTLLRSLTPADGDPDGEGADDGSGTRGEGSDDDDDDPDDDVEPLLKFRRVEGSLPEILAGDVASCLAVHHRYLVRAAHPCELAEPRLEGLRLEGWGGVLGGSTDPEKLANLSAEDSTLRWSR